MSMADAFTKAGFSASAAPGRPENQAAASTRGLPYLTGRPVLPKHLEFGDILICRTPDCLSNGAPGPKFRPILVIGVFRDPTGDLRAVFAAHGTTQNMNIRRNHDYFFKNGQFTGGKVSFSAARVIANDNAFFSRSMGRIPDFIDGCDEVAALLKCRIDALVFNPQNQSDGLQNHHIPKDWVFEGPLFTLPREPLCKGVFYPDVKGAFARQISVPPAGFTQEDIDRMTVDYIAQKDRRLYRPPRLYRPGG